MTEATDGGLKCLLGLLVTCSCLEGPGLVLVNNLVGNMLPSGLFLSSRYHLALFHCLDDLACYHLNFWIVKMYSLAVAAGCCG